MMLKSPQQCGFFYLPNSRLHKAKQLSAIGMFLVNMVPFAIGPPP